MTSLPRRSGDVTGVRLLITAVALASTLVGWVVIAQVARGADEPAAAPARTRPPAAADVRGIGVDATSSASGRHRGRR